MAHELQRPPPATIPGSPKDDGKARRHHKHLPRIETSPGPQPLRRKLSNSAISDVEKKKLKIGGSGSQGKTPLLPPRSIRKHKAVLMASNEDRPDKVRNPVPIPGPPPPKNSASGSPIEQPPRPIPSSPESPSSACTIDSPTSLSSPHHSQISPSAVQGIRIVPEEQVFGDRKVKANKKKKRGRIHWGTDNDNEVLVAEHGRTLSKLDYNRHTFPLSTSKAVPREKLSREEFNYLVGTARKAQNTMINLLPDSDDERDVSPTTMAFNRNIMYNAPNVGRLKGTPKINMRRENAMRAAMAKRIEAYDPGSKIMEISRAQQTANSKSDEWFKSKEGAKLMGRMKRLSWETGPPNVRLSKEVTDVGEKAYQDDIYEE